MFTFHIIRAQRETRSNNIFLNLKVISITFLPQKFWYKLYKISFYVRIERDKTVFSKAFPSVYMFVEGMLFPHCYGNHSNFYNNRANKVGRLFYKYLIPLPKEICLQNDLSLKSKDNHKYSIYLLSAANLLQ